MCSRYTFLKCLHVQNSKAEYNSIKQAENPTNSSWQKYQCHNLTKNRSQLSQSKCKHWLSQTFTLLQTTTNKWIYVRSQILLVQQYANNSFVSAKITELLENANSSTQFWTFGFHKRLDENEVNCKSYQATSIALVWTQLTAWKHTLSEMICYVTSETFNSAHVHTVSAMAAMYPIAHTNSSLLLQQT